MFGCEVFFILVQADSSIVRIRIFLAGMFGLTAAKSVLAHMYVYREKAYTITTVVAVAGMSDFSTASTNFCWMIGLREKRFHVLVSVAYLILTSEPAFDTIFLIKVLLMTELTIFAASFGVQ